MIRRLHVLIGSSLGRAGGYQWSQLQSEWKHALLFDSFAHSRSGADWCRIVRDRCGPVLARRAGHRDDGADWLGIGFDAAFQPAHQSPRYSEPGQSGALHNARWFGDRCPKPSCVATRSRAGRSRDARRSLGRDHAAICIGGPRVSSNLSARDLAIRRCPPCDAVGMVRSQRETDPAVVDH